MDLNQAIKIAKNSLFDKTCNWCGGEITLYGLSEIKDDKLIGAIKCLECTRVNPATFKVRKN